MTSNSTQKKPITLFLIVIQATIIMIFAGICYPVLAVANSTKGRTAVCEIMQQNSVELNLSVN